MNSPQPYLSREQRYRAYLSDAYDFAARSAATNLYAEVSERARWRQFWSWLRRKPRHLRALEAIDPATVIGQHASLGVQVVPLDRIVGSSGRSRDFDRAFYPISEHTRDRWISVADLWYRGVELPPVSLVQIGDEYFVLDGHHRISVARISGAATIPAVVTVWHIAEVPAAANPAGSQLCCALPGQALPLEEL